MKFSRSTFFALATTLLATTCHATGIPKIYVGDQGNNTIEVYDSSGVGSVFANLSGVDCVALDAAGDVFATSNNTVYKFTPAGVQSVLSSGGLLGNVLAGLIVDKAGNVYVADYFNNKIFKITPGGTQSLFASANLNQPGQMAFDSSGNLFVANRQGADIVKITPGGTATVFGSLSGAGALNLGVAIDKNNNVFASDRTNNVIVEFSPSGTPSTFATGGLLNTPKNLAFDNLGNLFVANSGAPSILVYTPAGQGSVFATTGLNSPHGIAFAPVPEPASWITITVGLVFLIFRRALTCHNRLRKIY